MPAGDPNANRAYYDAFSERYDRHRGDNAPGGYHELVDVLETDFVRRFGQGRDVLEVGCGTGLILERLQGFARSARGVDISPGMLARARQRELDVCEGSATELPFDDHSFDVTCSFKVLAHVRQIHLALSEMARVTRPGGTVIAEFYNPFSLRGLLKRFGPAGRVADDKDEGHVFTRFDSPRGVQELTPLGCSLVASRGVRIALPSAALMNVPGLRSVYWKLEHALCDTRLKHFAGFWIAAFQKMH